MIQIKESQISTSNFLKVKNFNSSKAEKKNLEKTQLEN